MNALSDLAAEVTAALGDRTVEVRLDGRDVRVAVDGGQAEHAGGGAGTRRPARSRRRSGLGGDAGDISRITLRLVEQIKSQAEQAAQSQGVSLNTWVSQAVQGALAGAAQRHGRSGPSDGGDDRRLRGWVQG